MKAPPEILLASRSAARINMLENTALNFTAIPANIDETGLIENLDEITPSSAALALARAKAAHFAKQHHNTLILGSDQILTCEGRFFSKAHDPENARKKLKTLRGKTHELTSALSIYYNGEERWNHIDTAKLTMHDFDDDFLEQYLATAGDALTSCVGAYALEEKGSWLFEKIEGDVFTILGMPLLPLLHYLQTEWGITP